MLTFFKEIFTWWNGQTLGTRLQTIFFGKLVGEDESGNKYYQNKKGKRWVIYNGEVEASKIPNDWYSWMHYTNNKIENRHNLKKYKWQKNHLPNQTGTTNAYNPKNNKNATKKKYKSWQD
ncbi:NADH:ubiquinone oxidoreductase subunit NDUFA12 [Candidatus Pelagibacter sp. RS40]|uniref:NADH:ubiquinone oxidoreductase subunit NDUFA12 n=1 Tax=Candidatus Pelagibacter sp. RS40 TaxID=1977865 RepID=UPI000A146844|nr:NADH:ubiquinone oxidoreductase subunit NDUFA12 [Candidatus Pelagibacter sp. RS40]ARJ48659.1 NADH-ubiquinone oxidoreductase [Candidatus Pelagibacter sp. RS40]